MASSAQLRQWWASYRCDMSAYVRVGFPGDGRTWNLYVAAPSADLWRRFAEVMTTHNYLFRETAGGTYNCRHVNHDPAKPYSLHAYAIALDLNPSKNRYGTTTTDMPKAFRNDLKAIRTTRGTQAFTWGGDWRDDPPDPMHWQLNVSPSDTELEEEPMTKIPLESWARGSFQWAIDNGFYTEKTNLNEVREEYDIQQMVVMMHRISKASSAQTGAHHHDGRYVKNVTVSK